MTDPRAELERLAELVADLAPFPAGEELPQTGAGEPARIVENLRHLARIGAFEAPDEATGGRVIGSYTLTSRLGEGGMGEVFQARQESPIRRDVALKIIKPGMDSRRVLARFQAERQTLAQLDHPHIAKVHDAGTTDLGLPYFVMELVPGEPVTRWCDRHRMSIPDRLELFLLILDAVQHAHHRGVIHRDLKPSNILVSERNGRAEPKIIDFGIAKATASEATGTTLLTEEGQLLGTPEYMSPEQAGSRASEIDVRSDVYSLGVILYELITGRLPIESVELRKAGLTAIPEILRTREPPTPGAAFDGSEDPRLAAERRGTTVTAMSRRIRGDLEWITLKALEKDPDRRYASLAEFGADIRRHLRNEPVLAGPPSTMYRLGKFARRHRQLVAVTITVVVTLVIGIITTSRQAVRARRAETEAREQAAVAGAVNTFLTDMLAEANPTRNPYGREMTVGEMLDEAALQLGPSYGGPPEVEAALRNTVGSTYGVLGRFDEAEDQLERAVALQRAQGDSAGLLEAISEMGVLASRRGENEKARDLAVQELALARETTGEGSPRAARALLRLGRTQALLGEYDAADSLFERGWADLSAAGLDGEYVTPLRDYAALLLDLGRYAEAEAVARRVYELSQARNGSRHTETADTMALLGRALVALGTMDEGLSLQRDALEIQESILGPENREVILMRNNLGQALYQAGRSEEALPLFHASLASARALLGPRHPTVANILRGEAAAQLSLDSLVVAEQSFREALEILREARGDHPSLCEPINDLAAALRRLGRYEEAEPLFAEAVSRAREYYGERHVFVVVMLSNLATTRANLGRYDLALETFRSAMALAEEVFPPARPEPDRIRSRYGECLMLAGRLGEAREVLLACHRALEAKVGSEHPYTRAAAGWLADLHVRLGDEEAARGWRAVAEGPE